MQRRERYDRKLAQILNGAGKVFAEKGFHNATVRAEARGTRNLPQLLVMRTLKRLSPERRER